MTMESTRYVTALSDEEPITLIHPAWVNTPESLTVTDIGGHEHTFERKS